MAEVKLMPSQVSCPYCGLDMDVVIVFKTSPDGGRVRMVIELDCSQGHHLKGTVSEFEVQAVGS